MSKKMIQPPKPWPRMGPDAMGALSAVEAHDCERLRKILDQCFWEGIPPPLEWEHLRTAIVLQDEPMMRLLITWNLRVPEGEHLSLAQRALYQKLLRRHGGEEYRGSVEKLPVTTADPLLDNAEFVKKYTSDIPQEWQTLLHAFHDLGAKEAVIAGGALRDLFNKRGITDVDIFLKDRGSQSKKREMLEKIFAAAGLPVARQCVECQTTYSDAVYKNFPDPTISKLKKSWLRTEKLAESWVVVSEPSKTKYNIIFVNGPLKDTTEGEFAKGLLAGFDLGLCQVGYNGTEFMATAAYKLDVLTQSITMVDKDARNVEHLERIVKKYPDWTLCENAIWLLDRAGRGKPRKKKENHLNF